MVCTALENGDYYVQKRSDSPEIEELFVRLEEYAKSQKLVEPEEHVKCVAEHEGMWYRATIISIRDGGLAEVRYDFFLLVVFFFFVCHSLCVSTLE